MKKFFILIKPDPFVGGTQEHTLDADEMIYSEDGNGIMFYKCNKYLVSEKVLIAFYRIDHVIMAGEMQIIGEGEECSPLKPLSIKTE